MPGIKKESGRAKRQAPARSIEARENQLIALAVDLAEKQLAEGTASSQVITHYLKLGTTRELLEKEKVESENALLRAKIESIKSAQTVEDLYRKALMAMQRYSGQPESHNEEDDHEGF